MDLAFSELIFKQTAQYMYKSSLVEVYRSLLQIYLFLYLLQITNLIGSLTVAYSITDNDIHCWQAQLILI